MWSDVPPTEAGWYYRTRSSVHPDEWVVTWEEGNRTTPLVGIKWARVPDAETLGALEAALRRNRETARYALARCGSMEAARDLLEDIECKSEAALARLDKGGE